MSKEMNLQNYLYQAYWHGWKKRKYRNVILKWDRNIESYRTARSFGIPQAVYIGDSNAEFTDNFEDSTEYNRLSVVFGFSGTTPDDYVNFLRSKEGIEFQDMLIKDDCIIVFSIGGNSVLQRKMDSCRRNLQILHTFFPKSYVVNIPPIHAGIIGGVSEQKPETLHANIRQVNQWLSDIWKERCIDLASVLLNPFTGEAVYGTLQDPVHYGRAVRKEIIKIVNSLKKD